MQSKIALTYLRFETTSLMKTFLNFQILYCFEFVMQIIHLVPLAEHVEPTAKMNKSLPHISIWLPHVLWSSLLKIIPNILMSNEYQFLKESPKYYHFSCHVYLRRKILPWTLLLVILRTKWSWLVMKACIVPCIATMCYSLKD